jgi:hypothetical protein
LSSKKFKLSSLPQPTASTPFFRRWFVDEKAKELADTKRLFKHVTERYEASGDVLRRVIEELDPPPGDAFAECQKQLVLQNDQLFELDEPDWHDLSMEDAVEWRAILRAQEHFLRHEGRCTDLLANSINGLLHHVADQIPETDSALFTVPLCEILGDVNDTIAEIVATFWNDALDRNHLFRELDRALYVNLCHVSGLVPDTAHKKPFLSPEETKLPPVEKVDAFLRNTPFRDLLMTPVPFGIPQESFFSHMHVVGGSGAGKTQWLSTLILHHLNDPKRPSLVVVDSQGDLINKLSHLKAIQERLVLISPKDIHYPPAINIFDVGRNRIAQYDQATKEQVVAGAIQTLDYLFSGIVGADLTAKQSVFFRFVARLMLALPETLGRNATLEDMIHLMDDVEPYQTAIDSLPRIQKQFFERDFKAQKTFGQTKEQIRYRLNAILENPTLERLFTSSETKLDIFNELNNGSIILIDTAKDFLKDASGNFGRIFIALILQAVMERAAIPEHRRRPTHLIIDEAQEYFDQNIDDLLTQVRKYRCGCVFAHQYLSQATPQLVASLAANTSIKMVSGVSTKDARSLAPDLRTTAEFILDQPQLHFACYVKNVTASAVSAPVVYGKLDKEEQVDGYEYEDFIERNRKRLSADAKPQPTSPPAQSERPGEPPERRDSPGGPDEIDTGASETW